MTQKCCIPICKLEKDSPGCSDLSFYRIPAEQKTREKWIQILNSKFNIKCKQFTCVCSLHFEKECFYYSGLNKYKKLKKGSSPTIFHNFENNELYEDIQSIGENDVENMANRYEVMDICTENEALKQSNADQLNQSNINIEKHLESNEYVHEERQTSGHSFYKTLAHVDLEVLDLDYSPKSFTKMKDMLRRAKCEIITLRRKNKCMQVKLCRWKKQIVSLKTSATHMKTEYNVSDILEENNS